MYMKPPRYCREPGDIELCTSLDKWTYGEGMYLGGYPPSTGLVEKNTLEEAQILCLTTYDCGGVTSVSNNSKFQLRRGPDFRPGNNENSWLKPMDPCPWRKAGIRIGACDEDAGGAFVTVDENDETKMTGIMSFADPSCDAANPGKKYFMSLQMC